MSQTYAPSGQQWTIRHGDQHATIVQVGGGIREYVAGGEHVLYGYSADAKASAGRGQVLMPWPNRIRDGRYDFAGQSNQLALTEPARHNAIHGLVRWALWTLESQDESSVVVGCQLLPQQGWDHALRLQVRYELGDAGVQVTTTATNVGVTAAPFGYGVHPYLTAGEPRVDEASMRVPAQTVIRVDDRLLPTGSAPVPPDLDFSALREIGDVVIDNAFTDLIGDDDGRWAVTVAHGERESTLWADAATFPYLQVFTGDTLPEEEYRCTGIAVEPMTCPPDAFASGDHLIVLEPGDTWSGVWGVRAS